MRNKLKMVDKLFIDACRGIIKSDLSSVRSYIKHGGDRNRQLTHEEVLMLNKTSQFTVGSTLIHLAVRFHQSDILAYLLTPAPTEARKRLPSHTNPELADDIREQVTLSLSHHQGEWACRFITQLTTYILPKEVTDLSPSISQKLLDEIVDRDVQKGWHWSIPSIVMHYR
jgi:ubiquitin thioesterase ZRANB1